MKPFHIAVWVGALAALAAGGPVNAAWNNVFQVCCHRCDTPAVSYYADPCCPPPCPQQVCTTRYVQRSYYQPVTRYETRTQYEPVTTYRTSYYWEPVTSYRVSCYYDPCTCSYRQTSVPVTSYQLRSQCCPVQSWVARCVSVPVTTQQLVTYYEPVTTCCTTTPGYAPPAPQPGTIDRVTPPQPGVIDSATEGNPSSSQKPFNLFADPMPHAPQAGQRQYTPPAAPRTGAPAAPPVVRLDKIVAVPRPNVEGEVVRADHKADAGARLTFRSVDRHGESQSVRADNDGRFRLTLASGLWDVYSQDDTGRPVVLARIEVRDQETRQVRLTSR